METEQKKSKKKKVKFSSLARCFRKVVSFQNELRRALSQAESEIYVPERIGQSEIVTEEQIKQLALRLPARVAGCTWSLVFTTSQHGFSLNSLYRKMAELDNPVLLLIKDTQGNVFGAYSPVELRVSELFYGTGEAFLFSLSPELRVFHWSGENSYFVKGNNESLVFGAGDGKFGLWLDGDLYQGRSQNCKTFHNDPLNPDEDFLIRTVECWTFV